MSYESTNLELNDYLNDQIKYSKRKFKITEMDSLADRVLKSDIIYLGDFHTFDQNIRNVLRIVKIIITEKSDCILALEMVSHKHQMYIDAYLEHHITDLEFLELINYHSSWRFPWTHYRLIFELAKKHKLKVIALNTEGSLHERDVFASKLLKATHLENPDSPLLVLYGELHITKNKIPALLKAECSKLDHTIIHQNLDEVYWKMSKEDIEQGIVSFSKNEYCIISAPPWIKYESMIYWYENLIDDPDFDIHEYIIENGAKIFVDDTKENFLHICSELITHLDLDLTTENLEDFNLYDHTHLGYIEDSLEEKLQPKLLRFYKYLISTNKSFRFPQKNTFYCSSYSMNRISYLAGIHIFHYYLQESRIFSNKILNSKNMTQKFILFCYEAMFGYFFSKIINPHRKCEMYQDLENAPTNLEASQFSILVLDSSEKDLSSIISGKKISLLYESSLLVGHILGEYLYLKANSIENKIDLKENYLSLTIERGAFYKLKETLLEEKSYRKHTKRYF